MDREPHTSPEDRTQLIRQIARIIASWGAGDEAELAERFEAELAGISHSALRTSLQRIESTGGHWGYHPPDPVARMVSRLTHAIVLESGSQLIGTDALIAARTRPVVFLGNHLSFVDANVVDALISSTGFEDVANRLTVVVGPKVFSAPVRRLASLSFGAIKIPQSTSRASGEAVMSIREVARLAGSTLEAVRARQKSGDHLLIFVEGTRSRTRRMQPALTAVSRYLDHPDATIIPFGVWGTEELMPVSEDQVSPARVNVRLGGPVDAAQLRRKCPRRAVFAQAIGFLIAELLPPGYRGHYATVSEGLEPARAAATAVGRS